MAVNTVQRDYDIARMLADYERRIASLERRLLSLAFLDTPPGIPYDTGWTNDGIVFAANFADYVPGGGNNQFEYRRIGYVVFWRGLVRRTSSSLSSATATVLTMPTDLWPLRNVITEGMSSAAWVTGAASAGTAHTHNVILSSVMGPLPRVVFNASGTVQVTVPGQMTLNIDDWVSFGGMSYPVELS